MKSFCETHILAFLKSWAPTTPLDQSLSNYFRAHKSLGSHDRKEIGEAIYTLIRWKSLFDYIDPSNTHSLRLHLLNQSSIDEWLKEPGVPPFAKAGLSQFLFDQIESIYGSQAATILATVNTQATVTVRANLMKTTRDKLLQKFQTNKFSVTPSKKTDTAIFFSKREPLFALPEFKEGLFEVQDEGSQRLSELIEAKSGDRVLDYCSGSGGKSLAIAPKMAGKGELYLHDIREHALKEASVRLRRAGVQNAQVLIAGHPTLKKLIGKMDWVLADVPCSGTGTLRRNPDMKWKIDQDMVNRLVIEQKTIFEQAVRYAKVGAKIVYATCSIFPQENEEQTKHFLASLPLILDKELKILPEIGGCDGFYGAVFTKKDVNPT
jgi:16S rRNA (cytosine967-C5)-methyltransferase